MAADEQSPIVQRIRGFADQDVQPRRQALRRLAGTTRTMLDQLARTSAPTDDLSELADMLETVVARLDEHEPITEYEGFSESANSGDPHAFFDHSPMLGLSNPLSPPLVLEMHEDSIVARATFGWAFEGPPGHVHGGFVAAAFDEVLGSTQSLAGAPGMTGRLTVHYRSPTPLHRELRFVGRIDRVDGRKIFTTAELYDGDRLCAEAEGLFISIDLAKWAELKAGREGT